MLISWMSWGSGRCEATRDEGLRIRSQHRRDTGIQKRWGGLPALVGLDKPRYRKAVWATRAAPARCWHSYFSAAPSTS